MAKREFRRTKSPREPQYPPRRLLALGAAAAFAGLTACGPVAVAEGVAVLPEDASVDAGLDASSPDASTLDSSIPDAADAGTESPDLGFLSGGAPMPDGGE
ncbi:MAG: hypothetical protein ACOX6T_10615 [Myxococcales bacterium]|jgi:hypothetical protein